MPLISIIVPVYNVENYIHRCVDSILSQTHRDFELILVDDGSPDSSGAICDGYAEKDSRIRVIHQQNRGAAAARNTGLDAASGEFIAFCDSDDQVAPQWLEHLAALAAPGVLPVCSYCDDPASLGGENPLSGIKQEPHPISECYLFCQRGLAGYLCNAVFDGSILRSQNLRLRTQHEKGDYNEDLLFCLQYARHIRQIVYTGYADYLYATREGSLSRSYYGHYFDKYEEKYILWRNFLQTQGKPEEMRHLASAMLYRFLTALNHADYCQIKRIVTSEAVQEAVQLADTSAENPAILRLIEKKAALLLWLRLRIHHLKGRFL